MVEENKINLKQSFTPRGTGENTTRIQSMIEELRNADISHTNSEKYANLVSTANDIIQSNIENFYTNYLQIKQEYDEMKEEKRMREAWERGVVERGFFELLLKMSIQLHDMLAWKIVQEEFSSTLNKKILPALSNARGMEIEREALQEFRRMDEERSKLVLATIDGMGNKFRDSMEIMMRSHKADTRENIQIMSSALSGVVNVLGQAMARPAIEDSVARIAKKQDDLEKIFPERKTVAPPSVVDSMVPKAPEKQKVMNPEDIFNDGVSDDDEDDGGDEDDIPRSL